MRPRVAARGMTACESFDRKCFFHNKFNPDTEAIGAVMEADLRARPNAAIVVDTKMQISGLKRAVREVCGVVRDRKYEEAIEISRKPLLPAKDFENCWDLIN